MGPMMTMSVMSIVMPMPMIDDPPLPLVRRPAPFPLFTLTHGHASQPATITLASLTPA